MPVRFATEARWSSRAVSEHAFFPFAISCWFPRKVWRQIAHFEGVGEKRKRKAAAQIPIPDTNGHGKQGEWKKTGKEDEHTKERREKNMITMLNLLE